MDVCLDPFVIVLYLPLCLWVIGCGEPLINVKGLEEVPGVIRHEGGAPVCIVDPGCTVQSPHMFEV